MFKRDILEIASSIYTFAVIIVITAFELVGDRLFFQSDLRSAFVFVNVLSLPIVAGLALVVAGLGLVGRRPRHDLKLALGRALAALILASIIYFVLSALDAEFRIFGLFRKLNAEYLFIVLWLILVVAAWYLISRSLTRQEIARRAVTLAMIASPASFVAFAALTASGMAPGGPAFGDRPVAPRHAVLVILDGWPAQHMGTFSSRLDAKPSGHVFDQALVFRNAHTSAAWTNAFFGTLYKGSPSYTYDRPSHGDRAMGRFFGADDNLLRRLQGLGVSTRVLAFHRNGLPEGSASAVSDYCGLRSNFLSVEYAPMLDALGLDYNLVVSGPGAKTFWADPRISLARRLLGAPAPVYDNALTEVLLPQLHRIQDGAPRTFTVFHFAWDLGKYDMPAAWGGDPPAEDEGGVTADARARDYRYDPENEWFAERGRQRAAAVTETMLGKIADFFDAAGRENALRDTILIFTADHGSINGKGRLWYGYHPNEEVLRVPFAVFGLGKTGVDDRMLESIDLPQTFIEHFGGTHTFHPRARSIFGAEDKPFAVSVTLRSDINREWFLAIYKDGRKYLFNLHLGADGQSLEQVVEEFEETTVAQGDEVIRRVLPELGAALDDYGIADADIHPIFHEVRRASQ